MAGCHKAIQVEVIITTKSRGSLHCNTKYATLVNQVESCATKASKILQLQNTEGKRMTAGQIFAGRPIFKKYRI